MSDLPEKLLPSLQRIGATLLDQARTDQELRGALLTLSHFLIEQLEEPAVTNVEQREREPAEEAVAATSSPPKSESPPTVSEEKLRQLRSLEWMRPQIEETVSEHDEVASKAPEPPIEIGTLIKHMMLKAEATEQLLLQLDPESDSLKVSEHGRALIREAQSEMVYLWMLRGASPTPDLRPLYRRLQGAFQACADITVLLNTLIGIAADRRDEYPQALQLAAESQSMLRTAIEELPNVDNDEDQRALFLWLRHETAEQNIYVERFMQARHRADAANWEDLAQRIHALSDRVHRRLERHKTAERLLNKLRYHTNQLLQTQLEQRREHDWIKVMETLDDWDDAELPASDTRLREQLRPLAFEIPADLPLPEPASVILEELYAEEDEEESEDNDSKNDSKEAPARASNAQQDPSVRRVARWLRDRTVVVIGGDERPHAVNRLKRAFELADVNWIVTRSHQPLDHFEAPVSRPEVAVVLLAIRWASHSFGEVKHLCDRLNKPFVRLVAGYNPRQVAYQIEMQASDQLAGETERAAD